jgi:hypothetical protein
VGRVIKIFEPERKKWCAQFAELDLQHPSSALLDEELEKSVVAFVLQLAPLLYNAFKCYKSYDRINKLVFFTTGSVLQGWRDAAPAEVARQCGRTPFGMLTVTAADAAAYPDSFSILSLYNYLPASIWYSASGSLRPWQKSDVSVREIDCIVEDFPALASVALLAAGEGPCPDGPGGDVWDSSSRQVKDLLSVHQPICWLVAVRFARAQFFVMSYRVHNVMSLQRTHDGVRRHALAVPTASATGGHFKLARVLLPAEAAARPAFSMTLDFADVPETVLNLAGMYASLEGQSA